MINGRITRPINCVGTQRLILSYTGSMGLLKTRMTTGRYRSDSIRSNARNTILKTLLGAMTLLNLVSCGSKVDPISSIATMNTDQLQHQYIDYLCQAYGQGRYENVRVELARRETFTSEEWKMIERSE